ncbi:hypothetical protein ACFQY4_27910 [Catellatospora bangladeshensis]|uniref:Lipoprotein n=1 Tax=Catellatospora bangladeshensis TaxID=310355 RepID=A0A8J3NP46_9ACTN|nr:hypothetical protein [Catellatospora bangladeshensis]GIF85490.1 hypothetical protein Cba03nite_68390 [Catellatospora bangladeshensis]
MRRRTLLISGMAGIALIGGGCSAPEEPPPTGSKFRSPSPLPSMDDSVRQELIAALQRTQTVPYQYTVKSDLTRGDWLEGSGAVDIAARRYRSTINSSGGPLPEVLERINIGTDSYARRGGDKKWVRLDMSRVSAKSFAYFDMADPIGLVKFISTVALAERTGPHGYSGWFNPNGIDDPFLPVGAPSLYGFGLRGTPFQVTTDEHGWVTSLTLTLTDPEDSGKLTMTTTFSGHGKPLKIAAPARSATLEADDFWYA